MTVDVTGSKFVGTGPGQDLDEIVGRWSADNLETVLGRDVIELVGGVTGVPDSLEMLRRITIRFLRERAGEMMARRDIRKLCLDAMSTEKIEELAQRIGTVNISAVRAMDPTQDGKTWNAFLGFFGIDFRGGALFAASLDQETIRPTFGLFPHQRQVAEKVRAAISGGHGRILLHMPTGAGKTRTAMHVVSRFLTDYGPCVVVWLANSGELLDQAADAFQEAWTHLGDREVHLVRFWGDHASELPAISDGLVIAGLQKMHALKTRDRIGLLRFANSVNLVVVDEAHQAIAPTYRGLIETVAETGTHNALVGLTATPGRTWSNIAEDERLSHFFGGQKATLFIEDWNDPVSFLMDEGYLARPSFRRLEIESAPELKPHLSTAGTSNEYATALLENLAEQVGRNVTIIDEAKRLIGAGHSRIILFGASVRHAEVLAVALCALEIDARVVTAQTAPLIREKIIKDFRRPSPKPMVLCNFGVLTAGFDAPNTSAAIIARPTKSLVLFSQMVGRATRGPKAGGNETCEVSTVVDIDLPGFGDVADAFTNWEDVWHDRC